MSSAFLAALLLGLALAASPPSARAAVQDGNLSVLIITEKGTCGRGYRYSVNVSNGRVSYQGDAAVNLTGTVAPYGPWSRSASGSATRAPTAAAACRRAPALVPGAAPAAGKPSGAETQSAARGL
jgi:hypothetical protein